MKTIALMFMTETERNMVRKFREAIPLSVSELARRAELTPQTIAKMEKGMSTRKNSKLKVAKALKKSFTEVFPD
ncbi:MAG: helix-turn-helix transcriptional regulator [Smithellaceae bacterium]